MKGKVEIKNNRKLTSDAIRELILRYLYEKRKKARGIKSLNAKISEIKKTLKKRYGLSDNEIISNLDFLIKHGWIVLNKEKRYLPKRGIEVDDISYGLSDIALHYFESTSKFSRVSRFGGINFEKISGIVVIGNENIVYWNKFEELYRLLQELKAKILKSDLPENLKLNIISQIETINAQLASEKPDKDIISKAWETIEKLASIEGMASLIQKAWSLLSSMI